MTTIPTIHLNGTSAKTLWAEYHDAYKAIDQAINALVDATCNGRDYYPQGEQAFHDAREERQEALDKLRDVKSYAQDVLLGIMAQSPDCD